VTHQHQGRTGTNIVKGRATLASAMRKKKRGKIQVENMGRCEKIIGYACLRCAQETRMHKKKKKFLEKEWANDVLARSIPTTEIGRWTTGYLSAATEEASQRLHCARAAPLLGRTAPDRLATRSRRRRIWFKRGALGAGNRWSSRPRRFDVPLSLGATGWCRFWNGERANAADRDVVQGLLTLSRRGL
jgi:hypothetical protein